MASRDASQEEQKFWVSVLSPPQFLIDWLIIPGGAYPEISQ